MDEKLFGLDIIDSISTGRPNLGKKMEVATYRLLQYNLSAVLEERFGATQTRALFQETGRRAGMDYCRRFLDTTQSAESFISQLRQQMIQDGMCILQVEKCDFTTMHLVFTLAEDLDCSGLSPVAELTVCNYDEGFIAGILEQYTGRKFNVQEIDCWGSGQRVCRFDIHCQGEPNV